jgi:hypothetical protein
VSHPGGGQSAQFLINQRQEILGSLGITLLGAVENARDFAHAAMNTTNPG